MRSGHHCTQPVMERFGVNATVRASLAIYMLTGKEDEPANASRLGKLKVSYR